VLRPGLMNRTDQTAYLRVIYARDDGIDPSGYGNATRRQKAHSIQPPFWRWCPTLKLSGKRAVKRGDGDGNRRPHACEKISIPDHKIGFCYHLNRQASALQDLQASAAQKQVILHHRVRVRAIGHGHQCAGLDLCGFPGQMLQKIRFGTTVLKPGDVRCRITIKAAVRASRVGIEAELRGAGA